MEHVALPGQEVHRRPGRLLERMVVALLARGHVLVEGVPGLAKTMAIKTLAAGDRRRVPAHPVHPRPRAGRPRRHPHLQPEARRVPDLARARCSPTCCSPTRSTARPAKVQSALLEVMQERQVTIGRETHAVPDPFLVMATQNPIESEGTYPLPEAQLDRFMLKVLVGYPTPTEEFVIVERMTGRASSPPRRSSTPTQLRGAAAAGRRGLRRPGAHRVRRAARRRDPRPPASVGLGDLARYVTFGASPRASINLILAGQGARLRARPRLRPARRTSATSRSTCCATASCCPTRRSPTASPPTTSSPASSHAVPLPEIPLARTRQPPRPTHGRSTPAPAHA